MRLLVTVTALLLAAGAWSADDHRTDSAQDVLARVNAEVITVAERDRVRTDLAAAAGLLGQADESALDLGDLERLALQNLIDRRLMLQEARRQQLLVSRKELDDAVSELRGRFADLESFGAWMQERGLDDKSLFDTVKQDILLRRVTATLIESASVSTQQVRDFYAEHGRQTVIGQEVRLAIISMPSVRAAETILEALRGGADFHALAREYSHGKLAARGGDTGWIDVGSLPPLMQEVVAGLRPGEASRPIRKNEHEFLIIAVAGSRPVHAESFDEAHDAIERHLLQIEQKELLAAWLRQRHEESAIETLAY